MELNQYKTDSYSEGGSSSVEAPVIQHVGEEPELKQEVFILERIHTRFMSQKLTVIL